MNCNEIDKLIYDEIMKSFSIPDSSICGSASTSFTQAERTLTMESFNASLRKYQDALMGFKIIESRYMTKYVQFSFPRTRKNRIMKKWAKNSRNFQHIPSRDIYHTPFGVICHPEMAKELRRAILPSPPGEKEEG